MALSVKSLPPRYALSDWHTANKLLRTNAENLRESSHTVRQEARRLRNETENHTRWTQHESNTKLEKRIDDINEWKQTLEKCLNDVDKEIEAMQTEKKRIEIALEDKKLPLDIAIECLMIRENRSEIDLVRDYVEEQLHNEVEVIEGIKALLHQKVTESFEQLCLLQEARHQLYCDLTDKYHALDIDVNCHHLNNESKETNFQVNPTRTVKGSVTLETWNNFSLYNKHRGEAETKTSQRLREAIFSTLEQTKNDLETQRKATEYEYRKRIHETNQAKNELEWQEKNTTDEIVTLEQDIDALKEDIDAKISPLKVAHTRLENRTHRRNAELCRDVPQYQLCHEIGEIEGTIKALNEKLLIAESALRSLQKDLSKIQHDLAVKTLSLNLDNECMEKRKALVQLSPPTRIHDERDLTDNIEKLSVQEPLKELSQHCNKERQSNAMKGYQESLYGSFGAVMNERTKTGLMKSTYNADYERFDNKRSGDLDRTLGRTNPTTEQTEGNCQELLVD